ncbi:MAG: AmmeMemoRadiSam system protein B [Candidatus Hodarchaeota archaeon]
MNRFKSSSHPVVHSKRQLVQAFALLLLVAAALPASACGSTEPPTPTKVEPTLSSAPTPLPTARPTAGFSELRPPAVAGAFYPADPDEAVAMMDHYLEAVQPVDGTPLALIVPHAGWVYSGHVAAYAYKQIEGKRYDTVVIIGPNHTDPTFDAISVYAAGAFETPLGPVLIDAALASELLTSDERIVFDRDVHRQEHSIEVQLPFLLRVCADCSFVPIIVGQPTSQNLDVLTDALVAALRDRQALIIASSDLSHYPSYDDAVKADLRSLAAVETMDDSMVSAVIAHQMTQDVPNLVTCACGQGPIVVAMRVAQALGADHVRVLRYANSGDVSGDYARVVGYGAVMFWRWQPPELSATQQAELLSIARRSLEEHLKTDGASGSAGAVPADPPHDPVLHRRLGAFVTLKLDGELRGCIGHMYGDAPLYQIVAQAAVDAATNDPRFPPLPFHQLDEVEIEISVLSPFKRVRDINDEDEIQVGQHGLYLLFGQQRGVLLPQVPIEQKWGRAQYLEQICFKAGLPADCWEQATLYTFTAQVFDENVNH